MFLTPIALSIGGLVLSATTLVPSWRRLERQARRAARLFGGAVIPREHVPLVSSDTTHKNRSHSSGGRWRAEIDERQRGTFLARGGVERLKALTLDKSATGATSCRS
jgi:hypothetical protein